MTFTKTALFIIVIALMVTCSRVGDIEDRLRAMQHSLEYQKR